MKISVPDPRLRRGGHTALPSWSPSVNGGEFYRNRYFKGFRIAPKSRPFQVDSVVLNGTAVAIGGVTWPNFALFLSLGSSIPTARTDDRCGSEAANCIPPLLV